MSTLAEDLVVYGIAQGFGTAATIFWSPKAVIPTGAGPYTSIVETGGTAPGSTHNSVNGTRRPAAQIVTRAATWKAANDLIQLWFNIAKLRNTTVNGVFYKSIKALQDPFDMPLDESSRARRAFNILVERQ